MRQIVKAAELVGHGMHMAEACVVEGHAGQILGVTHALARLHIPAVGHGAAQVAVDVFHGLFRTGVGHWRGRC